MTISVSGSQITFSDNSTQNTSPFTGGLGFRNRIINGDFRIDQRNAGASVTIPSLAVTYTIDRWFGFGTQASKFSIQQNAGSVTPPVGFTKYLGATSLSAYSVTSTDTFVIQQPIEGLNVSDLAWGTANASTITFSFWARSSLTGTFGGAIRNSGDSRCYVFSYTINAANTWEQKTITIPGDTAGTWLTTNGVGLSLTFSIGSGTSKSTTAGSWGSTAYDGVTGATSVVGTNGATFYITGVQLEKGSTATSFDYRPYGTELQLCQRYYEKSYDIGTAPGTSVSSGVYYGIGSADASGNSGVNIVLKVSKRTISGAIFTAYRANGTSGTWDYQRSGASGTASPVTSFLGENGGLVYFNVGGTWVASEIWGCWTFNCEL